jgi:hypothetical protein
MAVAYGRERLDRSGIQSLNIDGIAWGRGHRPLILDWFQAKGQLSCGVVEGFNAKGQTHDQKRPYGFWTITGWKSSPIILLAPYPSQVYPQIVLTIKLLHIRYRAQAAAGAVGMGQEAPTEGG